MSHCQIKILALGGGHIIVKLLSNIFEKSIR